MFGSLGMFSLVLAVLCPMSFVQGQAQQSNITIVSDASTLGDKAFQPAVCIDDAIQETIFDLATQLHLSLL
jgi:hypothetical protein